MQFQGFDWLSGHGVYHAQEKATIKLSSACSCKVKSERYSNIHGLFLIKQLFHSRLLDMR